MVPLALPNVYFNVWVNEEDARVIVIVRVFPIKLEEADEVTVDARGIVVRVRAEVEAREIFGTMLPVWVFNTAVMFPVAIVLVPSALCVTVHVPLASSRESFFDILLAVVEE